MLCSYNLYICLAIGIYLCFAFVYLKFCSTFLLQPPENELQKVGVGGERIMSEHQLRVQRSLQRLNVPDWYRNSTLPAQGFLLKRNSDAGISPVQAGAGWPGLANKTTSLSSLGSTQSAAPRSPTSKIIFSSASMSSNLHFNR